VEHAVVVGREDVDGGVEAGGQHDLRSTLWTYHGSPYIEKKFDPFRQKCRTIKWKWAPAPDMKIKGHGIQTPWAEDPEMNGITKKWVLTLELVSHFWL
jgi:hypothetical protein